LLQELGVPK
jgi:hypothetical protein